MDCSKQRNPYRYCHDNQQDKDQDEYRSRNNSSGFLHDYQSHHFHHRPGHVQTSDNGVVVLAESSNDRQILSISTTYNQVQEGRLLPLTLRISDTLINQIEWSLTQEKQRNNHHQFLSQPQPPPKLKASNLPAIFLKIGSWKRESKNAGDLAVKFYYMKKKLVWEFLFGAMKKKIEIGWTHVSAINAYVDEDKIGRLEIELGNPPEYYKECKFQPLKHTQWEKTDDFTLGQAQVCRRHTILFSPGVLDEHFEKLLQNDNHLLNLSRQPFPFHNSQFFNPNMEVTFNVNLYRCPPPVPLSNYDHQGTILPSIQNFGQPTSSSFVGNSGSNLPMPGLMFANSGDIAREVSYVNDDSGVCQQSPNNHFQATPFPPIGEQDDYEPYEGLEAIISDQQLQLDHVDNQNPTEVTTNCFNIDSICKPFEQNYQTNLNPYGNRLSDESHNVGELQIDPGVALRVEDYLTDDLSSGDGVKSHMAYIDDDVCSVGEGQFNDVFAIQEPFSWSSSQLSDNNGYGELTLHEGSNSMGYSLLEKDIEDKI